MVSSDAICERAVDCFLFRVDRKRESEKGEAGDGSWI